MARFTRSVVIDAPVGRVFDYWKDPANWPEVWPSMVACKVAELAPEGTGTRHDYKMAGVHFTGSGVFSRVVPGEEIVSQASGGIESTFDWTFEPEGSGTKMTARVEYTIPIPVLGKLAEAFVLALNEHEAEATLANLKARLES
jgi:uncharacterized protein YndB with AHSA1/START domain